MVDTPNFVGCIGACCSEPDLANANCRQCLETSLRDFYAANKLESPARREGKAEGLREAAKYAAEFSDAVKEQPQRAMATTIQLWLLARAEEVERG